MVKHPKQFKLYSQRIRHSSLRKLSLRKSIQIGENLIRAAFKARKPRFRRDNPLALSFYVRQSH